MGACVSNHQKPSAMKVQVLFGSNDIVKPPIIADDLAAKPHRTPSASAGSFRKFGSKDETFFDSQAWLESDCDDDFKSVNGDFTPSRGNTPVHHKFSAGNNKLPLVPAVLPYQPSPNGSENKMRLSDLFKDSLRGTYDAENEEEDDEPVNKNGENSKGETMAVNGGDMAANGGDTAAKMTKRQRFGKSVHGCFPSLLSSRSSNGRKMMSPGPGPSPNPNPSSVVG